MIGIDLVELSRIALNLERLANRILSDYEFVEYQKMSLLKRKIEYVGGRFAAKEAIFKAIDLKRAFNYKDFSVLNDEHGKPYVKTKIDINIEISISHTNNYATAIALIV